MMLASLSVYILYGQLAVLWARPATSFNDWTDQHIAQGFAWRCGSVSFTTLEESGYMTVTVSTETSFDAARSTASRALRVPFTVPASGRIEVASITTEIGSALFWFPPGEYELIFEHGLDTASAMWCKLHFQRTDEPVEAAILRADNQLCPGEGLLMGAEPA